MTGLARVLRTTPHPPSHTTSSRLTKISGSGELGDLAPVAAGWRPFGAAEMSRAQAVGLVAERIIEPHGKRLAVQQQIAPGQQGDSAAAAVFR